MNRLTQIFTQILPIVLIMLMLVYPPTACSDPVPAPPASPVGTWTAEINGKMVTAIVSEIPNDTAYMLSRSDPSSVRLRLDRNGMLFEKDPALIGIDGLHADIYGTWTQSAGKFTEYLTITIKVQLWKLVQEGQAKIVGTSTNIERFSRVRPIGAPSSNSTPMMAPE